MDGPRCGSTCTVQSGRSHHGKAERLCTDGRRPFVPDATTQVSSRQPWERIATRLSERIPLAGMARVAGLSAEYPQAYVNRTSEPVPREGQGRPPQRAVAQPVRRDGVFRRSQGQHAVELARHRRAECGAGRPSWWGARPGRRCRAVAVAASCRPPGRRGLYGVPVVRRSELACQPASRGRHGGWWYQSERALQQQHASETLALRPHDLVVFQKAAQPYRRHLAVHPARPRVVGPRASLVTTSHGLPKKD